LRSGAGEVNSDAGSTVRKPAACDWQDLAFCLRTAVTIAADKSLGTVLKKASLWRARITGLQLKPCKVAERHYSVELAAILG
jgi:hypothetical protein